MLSSRRKDCREMWGAGTMVPGLSCVICPSCLATDPSRTSVWCLPRRPLVTQGMAGPSEERRQQTRRT